MRAKSIKAQINKKLALNVAQLLQLLRGSLEKSCKQFSTHVSTRLAFTHKNSI